jgi:SAM-dependent methyltransferase
VRLFAGLSCTSGIPTPADDETSTALRALAERVTDLEAAVAQLEAILRHDGAAPAPPKHLQVRVVGGYVPGFIESGFSICDDLDAVLAVAGKSLGDFETILDWGCGCGRTTRALKTLHPEARVWGTDIDAEAIRWLQKKYEPRYGEFRLAPHVPPLPFDDGFFDFVAGISVFTHLPEDLQFRWLEELRRITRPGGLLIMTTSGEKNWSNLPEEQRRLVEEKGFFYLDGDYGQSISLPAFYQNAFHSLDYVRREWGKSFDILDTQPARLQTYQDMVLMRRRP